MKTFYFDREDWASIKKQSYWFKELAGDREAGQIDLSYEDIRLISNESSVFCMEMEKAELKGMEIW